MVFDKTTSETQRMHHPKLNRSLWLLIPAVGGCQNPAKEGSWNLDSDLTNVESVYSSEDPLNNTGLSDLSSEMNPDYCKTAWGNTPNVPGAVSYFSGIYLRSEDASEWTGREEWTLFPNSSWTDSF